MGTHHVHVYEIARMIHADIEAPSAAEAQQQALEMVQAKDAKISWDQSDARHIAVVFQPFDVVTDGEASAEIKH